MILLNFVLIFICFYVANKYCEDYSWGWWANMFASASNAVVVAMRLI